MLRAYFVHALEAAVSDPADSAVLLAGYALRGPPIEEPAMRQQLAEGYSVIRSRLTQRLARA